MASKMDTEEETSNINDLIICPICLDTFKDPKTLSCLHTFCAHCLSRCMNGFRRELPCPTCRRVTMVPASGIQGLQYDYRIEQMKDMLKKVAVQKEDSRWKTEPQQKLCDCCASQDVKVASQYHCIQCSICLCNTCVVKHNENVLFTDHQVVDISLQESADSIFCKHHTQHPIRYYCEACSTTLCSICTMNHDSSHILSALDKVVNTYKKGLQDFSSKLTSKLTEIKNVLGAADAYKNSTESTYLSLQLAIQDQTEMIIKKVKEQQTKLHNELKAKMEQKIVQCDTDVLKTAQSKQDQIVGLRQQIQSVIDRGHALQFLASFKDMKNKVDDIQSLQLPSLESFHQSTALNLVPNENSLDGIIGKLQESIVISDSSSDVNPLSPRSLNPGSPLINPGSPIGNPASPFINPGSPFINPASPSGSSTAEMASFMRCSSASLDGYGSPIPSPSDNSSNSESNSSATLSEGNSSFVSTCTLSPVVSSSSQVKQEISSSSISDAIYEFTATSSGSQLTSPCLTTSAATHSSGQPIIAAAKFKPNESPRCGISSRKRLILDAQNRVDKRKLRTSVSSASSTVTPPRRVASPVVRNILEVPRLLFKVDGVGGWPGKVVMPCSAAFIAGSQVVVAEKENRLQLFDFNGQSKLVFGWGQVRPLAVTVAANNQILVTDSKDKCVKVLSTDGKVLSSWGQGLVDPSDLAVINPDHVVVVDSATRMVKMFQIKDGKRIRDFQLSLGLFDQFHNQGVVHIAVDQGRRIIISDSGENCIKIFDQTGTFLLKFGSHGSKNGHFRRPHGVCVDGQGNIIVADHGNSRVSLFTGDGRFLRNLLTTIDGMKGPSGIAIDDQGHLVVTQTRLDSTIMKISHHIVSLYNLYE